MKTWSMISLIRSLLTSAVISLLIAVAAGAPRAETAKDLTLLAAGRIEIDTPGAVRIRGSDAIAGQDDWYLTNGTLCAAVLGTEHHGLLIPVGGNLVDLGHCGRDDDQFIGLEPMFNLSRAEMFRIREVEAQVDERRAQIVTRAREPGLSLVTRYVLDLQQPDRLTIHTRIERHASGARFFAMADMLLHAVSALRNFILNDGGRYSGFRHVSREKSRYLEIGSSIRTSQGVVLVGSEGQGPEISYLYRPRQSTALNDQQDSSPLDHYTLAFSSVTLTNWGSQPFWFPTRNPGVLQALQLTVMDLPIGESVVFVRELRLSKRADVASLSDFVYASTPPSVASSEESNSFSPPVRVTGTIDDPAARVHVFRSGDDATSHMTMARTDASGTFSFLLPRGRYRFEIVAAAGRRLHREVDLSEAVENVDLGTIQLAPASHVTLPRGAPMRIVFRGMGGTPDPIFGDDLTGLTLNGELKGNSQRTSDVHLAGIASDPGHVQLAPGKYQIYATRGPEFSLTKATLEVAAGEHATLAIPAPVRLFETPGWISADFHVHAARSFDSTLPPAQQLRAFVSEGGEVLVATDHDVVSDYTRQIRELGLSDRIATISGLEVTTISPTPHNPYTTGHINIYPVPYRPERNRSGAFQDEGLRLREIIALARALPEDPVVQLNHPRDVDRELEHGAFLDHLSVAGAPFDPNLPFDAKANRTLLETDAKTGLRDLDFDAIEVMNGKRVEEYYAVRRDWFSFLSQGQRVSGMANSDSHELGRIVGVPRNYVRVSQHGKDAPIRQFDRTVFMSAVRSGHLYGTTGPLLDVALSGAGPGDLHRGNQARLRVAVRAAPWVPVRVLRVFVNGALNTEIAIDGSGVESIEMHFERDSHLVVEVEGPAEGDFAAVLPGFTPLAFSNPIFVDADQDGQWTPPGLPNAGP